MEFSVEALVDEIEALRRDPPEWLQSIGKSLEPSVVEDSNGELRRPATHSARKWDLICKLQSVVSDQACEAYDTSFRIRLRFSRDWPKLPPRIRFLTNINHWLVDEDDQEMLHIFYTSLAQYYTDGSSQHSLRGVLEAIHDVLADPRSLSDTSPPTPALPGALKSSSYEGVLEHTTLGVSQQALSLVIQQQVGETEFEAKCSCLGQTVRVVVSLVSESHEIQISGATPVGHVLLAGVLDAASGKLSGSCSLNDCVGGNFDLHPVQHVDEIAAAEGRNLKQLKVIKRYMGMAKHSELFASDCTWRDEWLAPELLRAAAAGTPDAWRGLLSEHQQGLVFSFPLFTEAFCEMFVEEIYNFYASGLPARRPNSMNNYGIILSDIGLEPLIDSLQDLLRPLGELLWADDGAGLGWDSHHCFIVRYREGEDLGLDMHHDDSDVTFNACLGVDFGGAGLQFCGLVGSTDHRKCASKYQHVKGRCVCHLGRHRHGADDITWGERLNIILWNRSSAFRQSSKSQNASYDQEEALPDLPCLSYTHDRDYGAFKSYPLGKEDLAARAWCPPKYAEYPNFRLEAAEAGGPDTK